MSSMGLKVVLALGIDRRTQNGGPLISLEYRGKERNGHTIPAGADDSFRNHENPYSLQEMTWFGLTAATRPLGVVSTYDAAYEASGQVLVATWHPMRGAIAAVVVCSASHGVGQGDRVDDTPPLEDMIRLLATALAPPLLAELDARNTLSLTDSERDVLVKLSEGMRPSQIAQARGTSERTVQNQIARLRGRLDARTDAAAITVAFRLGLL